MFSSLFKKLMGNILVLFLRTSMKHIKTFVKKKFQTSSKRILNRLWEFLNYFRAFLNWFRAVRSYDKYFDLYLSFYELLKGRLKHLFRKNSSKITLNRVWNSFNDSRVVLKLCIIFPSVRRRPGIFSTGSKVSKICFQKKIIILFAIIFWCLYFNELVFIQNRLHCSETSTTALFLMITALFLMIYNSTRENSRFYEK